MKRKMVSEMLKANIDVERISKSLNCSPVLVEKVRSLGPRAGKQAERTRPSASKQVFTKPTKPLTQDEMAKMVLQMIKAKEKAEEICRVVGCERQFVFQVRTKYNTLINVAHQVTVFLRRFLVITYINVIFR